MLVKKFEAETLEKALGEVKRTLGNDALVLSTETVRRRWWQKPRVVLTAAVKSDEPTKKALYDSEQLARVFPHRRDSVEVKQSVQTPPRPATAPRPAEERMVVRPTAQRGSPEDDFVERGFSAESAREYSRLMMSEFSREDRRDPAMAMRLRAKLVASGLRTLGPEVFESRRTWAVVGLPGAGKTSLTVKLAQMHLSVGNRVLLISTDRRKLIGIREMAGYAKLLGAEFKTEASDRPSGVLTFVDTPGLVWSDEHSLSETDRICRDASTLLVLDASQRLEELNETVSRAQRFAPVAIAFTRLDQVSRAGVVHDVIRAAKLPLLGCSVAPSLKSSFRFFDPNRLASYIVDFQNQRRASL